MTVYKKPQTPEQILADEHKRKNCLIVISGGTKIMENFRDLGGQPCKKEVKARPEKGQTLKQLHDFIKRDDGGLTRSQCLFTFREWKYWIIVSSEKNITRAPVATNQIYWSKTNNSSFFEHPCFTSSPIFSNEKFSLSTKFRRFSKYY